MGIKSKLLVISTLVLSTSANAALISRLGGLAYYDDVADLTWLADANIAGTSMNWSDANNWVAGLDIAGVTGWRLPDTLQLDPNCSFQSANTSYGVNCTGSEMGNLFYNVLGGSANTSITTTHNANYDLFSNVLSSIYWTATGYLPDASYAWEFSLGSGSQGPRLKTSNAYVWVVHSGNVSAVPVPAAAWLFGSGLIGLVGLARRKKT